MASGERITTQGVKSLQRQLKALDHDVSTGIKAANLQAASTIAVDAKVRAPKGKTKKLSNSIRATATKFSASVRVGGARVPYAPPVHWGWPRRGIAPQPFLYQALDAKREAVIAAYAVNVERAVGKVVGGRD